MSEKGTLCHATTRWETVWGQEVEGEMKGLEGREKAFSVFLSGNT